MRHQLEGRAAPGHLVAGRQGLLVPIFHSDSPEMITMQGQATCSSCGRPARIRMPAEGLPGPGYWQCLTHPDEHLGYLWRADATTQDSARHST